MPHTLELDALRASVRVGDEAVEPLASVVSLKLHDVTANCAPHLNRSSSHRHSFSSTHQRMLVLVERQVGKQLATCADAALSDSRYLGMRLVTAMISKSS